MIQASLLLMLQSGQSEHAVQRMDKSHTSSSKSLRKFLCFHLIRYIDMFSFSVGIYLALKKYFQSINIDDTSHR